MREQIQQEASQTWLNTGCRSILKIKTGTGKTRIACKCIILALEQGLINNGDSIDVYAEVSLGAKSKRRKDFLKEWEHENVKGYEIYFKWYTYQSKTVPTSKLIVLDEIDTVAEILVKPFENYQGMVVGLTATLSKSKRGESVSKHTLLTNLWPVSYEYDFNQALEDGLSNEVHLYKIPLKLDNKLKVIQITKGWKGTELEYWNYWKNKADEVAFISPEFSRSIKMMKLPRFLYNLPSKINIAKQFLSRAKYKTLGFAREISFLKQISMYTIEEHNYSQLVDMLDKGQINHLLSSKKVQRGENINDIKNILLIGIGKNSDTIEQLIGRSRLNQDKITNVFVFVTEGTYEEKWFDEITKKRNSSGRVVSNLNFKYKGEWKPQ